MKDLFLRFCRWALPLLGVAAVTSCEIVAPSMYGPPPSGYDDMVCMYGTPVVEFSVKGRHIITKVVKTEFVIRTISNICEISVTTCLRVWLMFVDTVNSEA